MEAAGTGGAEVCHTESPQICRNLENKILKEETWRQQKLIPQSSAEQTWLEKFRAVKLIILSDRELQFSGDARWHFTLGDEKENEFIFEK